MSEEDFIRNLSLFSSLKFRASYGKTGNQAIAEYSTLPSLSVTNAYFNSNKQIGYTLGNIANPNLKWETTDQYNAGLDMGFLDERITFTADVYYKKTYNLLLSEQIAGTTGYSSRLNNIGTVENRGIEFNVDAAVVDGKIFSWNIGFNLSINKNKVLDLGSGLAYRDLSSGARLIVGKPAPVFFGAIYEGTFKSQAEIDALPNYQAGLKPGAAKFKDVNGNGKYEGLADYGIIGNPEPKFFGGVSSSLKYKRFDLNMYFSYSYGNDVINSLGPRLFAGEYASNVGAQALNRWTPDNNQSNLPGVGASGLFDVNSQAYSFAVQDGSFFRLKTVA